MDFKVMGVHEAKRYSMKPTGKIIASYVLNKSFQDILSGQRMP